MRGSQRGFTEIRSGIFQISENFPNIDHGPLHRIPNIPKSSLFDYGYDLDIEKTNFDPF